MAYKRTVWENGVTPINAANLNNMEEGIVNLDEMAENALKNPKTTAEARQNINFIGTNPIASAEDDTPANWIALGTGHAYINGSEKLKSQPTAYGYLETRVYGTSRVEQIFKSNMNGSTMLRTWKRAGGTSSGWFKEWALILDETNGIQKKKLWENASPSSSFPIKNCP